MRDLLLFFCCISLCFGAAGLGGIATSRGLGQWYDGLVKPPLNPPAWVFGPVWTVLYLMMAVSLWRVWRRAGQVDVSRAVILFVIHLLLNAVWSWLFFGMGRPDLALVEIVVLWASIAALIYWFWPIDKVASYLLVPYLAWVSFATYLNGALYYLNR